MYARGYLRTHHSFARRLVLTMTGLALTLGALPALTGALPGTGAGTARADDVTASQDALRTGWDPNDAGLTPAIVGGGTFQNLFKTPVNGQVYAQPVVVPVGAGNHIVIVATENDYVYGLDPATGVPQWTTHLGNPFVLAKARWKKVRTCKDLTPNIGVTGTPAYDPVTKDVYMFGEIMVGKYPKYYLYGINPSTGTVDMKVAISGKPRPRAAAASCSRVSDESVVNRMIASPRCRSERQVAACMASAEAARAMSSTISSDTISPAILAKRLTRPTTDMKPSSSRVTTSPVSYQPSPAREEGGCSTPGASQR